jgi:hypothetical protein
MIATHLAWYHMVNVHLALICATQLTEATIALEHTLSLLTIAPTVQLI